MKETLKKLSGGKEVKVKETPTCFSKQWTDEERLKLVILLAEQIQSDIPAGRYGAALEPQIDDGAPVAFRPNMQSIIEIIASTADVLEAQRPGLEKFVRERLEVLGQTEAEFYGVSLAEQRLRIAVWESLFGDPKIDEALAPTIDADFE